MTSVNGDTFTVLEVFSSVTVMLFAVTEEITVSCAGGGVAFFFAFANDGAATPQISRAQIKTRRIVFIIYSRFPGCSFLLLVHRHFRQGRRLNEIFLLFFFLGDIDRLACRVDQTRSDENDQIAFDVLIDIGSE